ncbi:MAG: hypothetical protein IBJ00_05695 [Alphaproteobacteria bacterium]|nr:hypothetical protein [Alphaproteobacteria bacterium]
MKKILFLVSCSIVAFNFNNTFASQNNEDEEFQTALKLSMENTGTRGHNLAFLVTLEEQPVIIQGNSPQVEEKERYDHESLKPIGALTEAETEKRSTTLPGLNEKAAEETQEKSDDFYLYKAAEIIKNHQSNYEDTLKYITSQEKSQYYPPDEVRSIPAIIYDLEHDGDNTFEMGVLRDSLTKEMEERGQRHNLFKPQKKDYIQEIAQQLNISLEKAKRIYKNIMLE